MKIYELDALIKAVAPIEGCSSNGAIWFKAEATPTQRTNAQAIMDSHISEIVD
jgi:hypothetical protein